MLPIGTTAPHKGVPVLILGLIVLCTAVFLYQEILPRRAAYAFVADYALIPRRFADPAWALRHGLDPNNYLPLLSMAFLHGGWLHLILNMWTLWLFGRPVESRMGMLPFAMLYLLCALLASWAQMKVYPDSDVPTLGASGAIAGVLGAHAMLFPRSKVVLLVLIIFVPLFFRISILWYLGFWFAVQVLQGAGALLSPTFGAGVAWWAHIGGFLAGLLFVLVLTPPSDPRDRDLPDLFDNDRSSRWPRR